MAAQLALMRATQLPTDASFIDGGHDTAWTSFNFFDDARIYLPAKVNGQSVDVLLDSGTGVTSVDTKYAARLGLKPIGETPVHGTGGDVTAQVAEHVTIDVAGVRLRNLTVLVFDLAPVSARIGRRTDVIVGREAFANLIVDLDLPQRRLAFHDPATWAAPAGAARVSLTKRQGAQRQVPVSIEGKPPIEATFDIGNRTAMTLPQPIAERAGVGADRARTTFPFGGVGGRLPQTVLSLRSVTFAGATVHDVPVFVTSPGSPVAANDANLGMPVLRRYRLMTDYMHDSLYAIADPAAIAGTFPKDRSGLVLEWSDHDLHVAWVAPGSPAEAEGWKVGEEVVAIDGARPGPDFSGSQLSKWGTADAGRTVTLTLASGAIRKLTLRDYY